MGLAKLNEGVKLPQNITILVSHGVSGMAILRTFKSVGWIPLVAPTSIWPCNPSLRK